MDNFLRDLKSHGLRNRTVGLIENGTWAPVSGKQMAELLNCTEQHYQRMEYGKVNLPATTVIFLADYFGVTADYLLGRE